MSDKEFPEQPDQEEAVDEQQEASEAVEESTAEADAHIHEEEAEALQPEQVEGTGSRSWLSSPRLPWTLTGLLCLAILVMVIYLKPFGNPQAVAKVNGEAISRDQMYEAVMLHYTPDQIDQVIEQLISEELIRQAAEKQDIVASGGDVEHAMEELRDQFPSEDQFRATLEQYGMTVVAFEKQMETQVLLNKMLEPQIKITDDEVKERFEQNKQEMSDPEQIRASHILVKTKEQADKLLKQLQDGADFAKLAQENSTDGSASQGGDLGYFGRGDMVAPFEEAAFALKKGEISDVVQTDYGFHIIKVTDVPKNWTLEEKHDELYEQLKNQKLSEKSSSWLEEQRAKAEIEKLFGQDDTDSTETDNTADTAQ